MRYLFETFHAKGAKKEKRKERKGNSYGTVIEAVELTPVSVSCALSVPLMYISTVEVPLGPLFAVTLSCAPDFAEKFNCHGLEPL